MVFVYLPRSKLGFKSGSPGLHTISLTITPPTHLSSCQFYRAIHLTVFFFSFSFFFIKLFYQVVMFFFSHFISYVLTIFFRFYWKFCIVEILVFTRVLYHQARLTLSVTQIYLSVDIISLFSFQICILIRRVSDQERDKELLQKFVKSIVSRVIPRNIGFNVKRMYKINLFYFACCLLIFLSSLLNTFGHISFWIWFLKLEKWDRILSLSQKIG